jgi:fructokinase
MTTSRVLCLGEILFDCLADQLGQPLDRVESWTLYPGGAPANVACGLVKLGTSAGFIGCVGKDEPGNQLVEVLRRAGVDRSGVQRHDNLPTRQVYVLRSQSGDREFAGFGDRPTTEFADTRLQADRLPEPLFQDADFLVLGTLELAYPDSQAAIERAIALAERHYVKILLDINWRPMFWPDPDVADDRIRSIVNRVDYLKLSDDEAEWLFDTADAGAIKHRLSDVDGVLVTAGAKGAGYCLGDNEGKLPAYAVNAVDTTGSGDGFVAGFLHQLCQHGIQGLEEAEFAKQTVVYASAVGALTATKPGAIAAQPTAAEVEEFVRSHQSP